MESSRQDFGSIDVGAPEVPRGSVPNGRLPPPGISILDRLIKTCPVWLQLCMSPKQAASILSEEAPGVFLVTRDVHTKCMVLWVRSAERRDPSDVLRYNIREEKTMMYLEGSFLVFEDIFKLIGFFCVSRDILPSPLRLPSAICKARTLKDLETLSNLGSGFWDSPFRDKRGLLKSHSGKLAPCGRQRSGEVSDEPSDCACEVELSAGSGRLWFVNPIFIEEFGNTQTCDQLPPNNFVANAKVQHPKVFYRRPPPPPPSLHKPPLPSLPPSAPPPEFIHPHSRSTTLDSPVLTSPASQNSCDTSLISPTQTEPLLVSSPSEALSHKPDSQCSLDESLALEAKYPVPPSSSSSVAPLVEHQTLCCSGDPRSSKTQPLESGPSSKTQPLKLEPSSDTPPLESGSSSTTQPLESGPSSDAQLLESGPSSDAQLLESGPSSDAQPLESGPSSDAQPLESGPSSDAQPLESGPSSDAQPLESGPSSDAQPLESGPSSDAQPLESGPSSDAQPLESEQPSKSSPSKTSSPEYKTAVPLSPSTAPTQIQAENSSEGSSIIEGSTVTDDHIVEKQSTEMRISNTEEKKEISGHNVHSEAPPIRTPVRVPPAVPKRRPSGKVPENTSNVVFSVKSDHQDKVKSPVPKTSRPMVKQAEDHIGSKENEQQSPTKNNKVSAPRHQPKAPVDEKKIPPVPPPRLKKLSSKYSPSEAGPQRPQPKSGSESPKTPETPNNVKIRDRKERQKSLASQDLKGSDSSLNSPTSGPNTPSSNPEIDSNSNSSADEDCERPVGASIKKSHSFMLDRAKNRLSIVAITNVFSAFMSADRKLQKRITELAHDKDSYFGNLVQDYKAYSLEMMAKQSSSTEMLQEIRLMMTQLKSYLVQSTELKSMADYNLYTDDKIDAIVEAALCKCVLKPLKAPIECYLREIHNKDGSLRLLTENQLVIQDTTTTDLGVTTSVPDSGVMEKIIQKFSTMHKTYSPEKKITYLLKACKLIYDSMATGNPGRHHGADDFLPVLMYVLARCDLVALLLDVEFMMELMDPSLQLGEGSYYLTTTYGALEHIKNYDKITVTRQLSLEVQDSIHRWERRRTLNKARVSRSSIQDFITISFEELEVNTRTLATKPDTRVAQVLQQCVEKFEVSEPHKYGLFVLVNEKFYRLAEDALPQQVKSRLLKNEQKLDFHFLYKTAREEDTPVRDLDFL